MENLWQVGLDCVKSAFVSPFKRHATGCLYFCFYINQSE